MNFFEKMIEIAKSMGVKDFAYYKKWALDHLKKQLDEDKTVAKAIEWCEEYMEKAYGVGTIRTWKGKKYIKGPDKKWRRYYDKKSRGTSQAIAYIMKEINSLENGDVEGLYNIIQKNAGRFRDENGNVLPEVQQIHDLVEKKQSGTTEKNSKVEEKKEENTGYTITNKNGVKLTRENALKRINGSLDTARASLKTYEESIKNSDISMKVAAETQIDMSLNHAKDLIGRLKPEDKKELETELKKLSDELEDLRKYNTNKVKESEKRNQKKEEIIQGLYGRKFTVDQAKKEIEGQINYLKEMKENIGKQPKGKLAKDTENFIENLMGKLKPEDRKDLETMYDEYKNGGIKKSFLEQIKDISKSMNKAEPKHDLEYYKKWALSILDKQKEEPEEEDGPNEETIVKALAYTEMIAKAGYPVGTIREWKGKKYIKVAPNQWKPKYDSVNRGAKMSLGHLKKAVSNANSEEELYNIINTNASRFRDENGRPFPEVQELHDMVTKRQGELNPAENGNSGEEIGGESKGKENAKGKGKEKMTYADKIAAIQKMGKKAESAVQNTGSGHVDNAIENAANDVVDSTKNAAAKEEKKKVAAQKKTSEPGISEEEKDKWLSQFEKDSSNSEKNDVKSEDMNVSKEDKINAVAEFLSKQNGTVNGWKEQLSQMPDSFINKKYNEMLEGEKNKKAEEKETFESLTEQYNATKDPDEREKLLNKIMALEETKKEKISEMKEENEKEQGYSEKTKEEIDSMNREEYHQYMSRSQKTIPLDKIGYGGGHVTDLDNAYKMCQKIAETYGDTPEGIDKLNTFLIYNTNTASRMYDELNEKLGIDYALLDADHNLAYKNAMKTLLGTKTKKDLEKEKNAVGKYEDRMSAALKKLL